MIPIGLGREGMKTLAIILGTGLGLALVPAFAQADGTLKGQIVYAGDPPKQREVKVDKDVKECLKNGPIESEELVVNKDNKGVKWVMVWLTPAPGGGKMPKKDPKVKAVTLDQPCCKFEPHVMGMQKGQTLEIKNSATIAHNTNYQGPPANPGGNPIVPAGKSLEVKNLVASSVPITVACNIHGWMKGYIGVFDHPYFAVTDENGKFEIPDAPAGKFNLLIWQEKIGWGEGGKTGKPIEIKDATDLGKIELKAK
jgi:hypothetical protein